MPGFITDALFNNRGGERVRLYYEGKKSNPGSVSRAVTMTVLEGTIGYLHLVEENTFYDEDDGNAYVLPKTVDYLLAEGGVQTIPPFRAFTVSGRIYCEVRQVVEEDKF